jgi:hypothetical protein
MKRQAEDHLGHWFGKRGRKPLVIRGARQVGKSTLVRNFAKSRGLELVEINLEKRRNLDKLFATLNIAEICRELKYLTDIPLGDGHGKLLFLDELQAVPEAIPCLRYFHEDAPGLAVVGAGSLLEFTLSAHHFSMPVGRVEYLHLGPMSFVEFLEAHGEATLLDLITTFSWGGGGAFPASAHDRLCALLRDFLIVGGMPEAVSSFAEEQDIDGISDIHLSILETYQDDFAKYARHSQLSMIQTVFQHAPRAAGSKVKYSNINPHAQAREVKAAIDLLAKAGVISKVHHSSASGPPLGAGTDPKIYKLYFLDVGLANTMCGTRHISLESLRDTRFVNEGNVAEQFIAQHLLHAGRPNSAPELFYWLRETKGRNAELDFIVPCGDRLVPVEVKAGKAGTLKSLHQFVGQRDCPVAIRFDLNPPARRRVEYALPQLPANTKNAGFTLVSLPLYMASRIDLATAEAD